VILRTSHKKKEPELKTREAVTRHRFPVQRLRWIILLVVIIGGEVSVQSIPADTATAHRASPQNAITPEYHVIRHVEIGDCSADVLAIDMENRRLYGACNKVIDLDTYSVVGELPDNAGHGYALAPELGRGLTRAGLIFDLKSLHVVGRVAVSSESDELVFEHATHRAFVLAPDRTAVVDMATAKIVGQISLQGKPEAGVADGERVYVNLSDRNSTVVINARTLEIEARWQLDGCSSPQALSLDGAHHRIFVSCQQQVMVLDTESGRKVAEVPTPRGPADQTAFDPGTQLLLSPNAYAEVTVIHEDSPDRYSIVQVVTVPDAHDDLAIDTRTHRAFLYRYDPSPFTVYVLAPAEDRGGT
jgi:hypothetical protein